MATASAGAGYPTMMIDTTSTYNLADSYMRCVLSMPAGASIPSGSGTYMKLRAICGSASAYIGPDTISYPAAGTATGLTMQLPIGLANGIPTALMGDCRVMLQCYVSGAITATAELTVRINILTSDVGPTATVSAAWTKKNIGSAADTYYTSIDELAITAAITLKYGATLKSSSLSGTELPGKSPNAGTSTYKIAPIKQTGSHTYTLDVKDSRGLTVHTVVSATPSGVTINSYTALNSTISAERCDSNNNPDPTGTGLKVTLNSDKTGNNVKATVKYKLSTDNNWTTLTSTATVSTAKTVFNYTGITLGASNTYNVQVTLTDGISPTPNMNTATVPQGFAYLYLNAKDKALGVGAVAGAGDFVIGRSMTPKWGTEQLATTKWVSNYRGYINENETQSHTVESGAYMLITCPGSQPSVSGIWIILTGFYVQNMAGGYGITVTSPSETKINISATLAAHLHLIRLH